jgi:hypothetical protein
MKLNKKNRNSFEGLYNYFNSSDYFANHGSSFSIMVTSVEAHGQQHYVPNIYTGTSSCDVFPFILKLYNNVKEIGLIRKARKSYYSLPEEDRNVLFLVMNNENLSKFKYPLIVFGMDVKAEKNINYIALMFILSKCVSFEQFHKQFISNHKKNKILKEEAKKLFNSTLEKYLSLEGL